MGSQRISRHGTLNVTDVDRLSDLPDNVILRILSFLQTEETIRTGVLSRRWKDIWKKTTKLNFDSDLHNEMFGAHVLSTLTALHNREIECLTLKISKICDPLELAITFTIACSKKVANLALILDEVHPSVSLPVGPFNRHNVLKNLKMMGNFNLKLPAFSVSFTCLKELHLYHVRFDTDASVKHLFRGCPVLEELVVVICNDSGVWPFIIDSRSLLRLKLRGEECEDENFVIKTPCLKYMNIERLEGVDSFRIEDAPELVEVKFGHHDFIMDENILSSVTSVQFLSMSGSFQEPVGKMFYALTKLEFYTRTEDWCELLITMLMSSPRLQILKLFGGWHCRGIRHWTPPAFVPDCLQFSLHTLDWCNLSWDEDDEINVATYILKNGPHLMKATFTTWKPSNAARLQHRDQMIYHLSTMRRASSSCQLRFKDD